MYGNNEEKRTATQNVLLYVYTNLLKLFHPFIPFVTEYIYQNLPVHDETIMFSAYPKKVEVRGLKNDYEKVINLVKQIRAVRSQFQMPDNMRTKLHMQILSDEKLIKESLNDIVKLGFGTEIVMEAPKQECVKVISEIANVYIPISRDTEKEKTRLNKEIDSVKFEIIRSEKMLANAGFISKAPKALVDKENEKLEKNKELLKKLNLELKNL